MITIITTNLLVNTDGVESSVHDIDPTVFGRKDKEGHQCLAEIVKVIGPVHPHVAGISRQTIGPVTNHANVRTLTIKETALKQLQRSTKI